jgi:heat shock transcription factor, other eukaryote
MPDLSQFAETQAQLELLQKMSEDTNSRVQHLQERLQPLSPSGSIPGIEHNNNYFGDPGTFDLNNYVQNDDFFTDLQSTNNPNDQPGTGDVTLPDLPMDFADANHDLNGANFAGAHSGDEDLLGFDGTMDGGGKVESVASSVPSPAATVEDADDDQPKRSPKRRKK